MASCQLSEVPVTGGQQQGPVIGPVRARQHYVGALPAAGWQNLSLRGPVERFQCCRCSGYHDVAGWCRLQRCDEQTQPRHVEVVRVDQHLHGVNLHRVIMHLPGWAGSQATLDQSCEAPRVRLTGLDTAFLCLDRDVSPMHLGALAIFRPVHLDDPGRLAAVLADRAQCLPQLCQRVQPSEFPLAAAVWVDDPGFCAKDHIELHSLDCPGGPDCRDSAAELAVELMIRPMQRNRPLWEFHVISGLEGGRFAVLFKMHHAFCDGLSLDHSR